MRPYRIFADLDNLKYPFFFLLVMAKTKRKPSKYNVCVGRAIREMKSSGDIKEKFKKAAAMCSNHTKKGKRKK